MTYKRVFVSCSDKLYLEELYLQLAAQLPGADIVCGAGGAVRLPPAEAASFDLVLASARSWNPCHFTCFKTKKGYPPLGFLLEDRERSPYELYNTFRYCVQAPFRQQHISWMLTELKKPDLLRLPDWDFLLLKVGWKYTTIPFNQIRSIERRDSLCLVTMMDGTVHETFYSVVHLLSMLPPDRFAQIRRGLVVPSRPAYIIREGEFTL